MSFMQINKDHLTILNDTRIQDGHHEIWEQEYVAGIVAAEVDVRDINTVCDSPGLTLIRLSHWTALALHSQRRTGRRDALGVFRKSG